MPAKLILRNNNLPKMPMLNSTKLVSRPFVKMFMILKSVFFKSMISVSYSPAPGAKAGRLIMPKNYYNNFEDSHMLKAHSIEKMMRVLAVAFAMC